MMAKWHTHPIGSSLRRFLPHPPDLLRAQAQSQEPSPHFAYSANSGIRRASAGYLIAGSHNVMKSR
ncbi:hypothetical protein DAQ1742_01950 [Dickeya aquatica]|uniref:Uncharacterized protein n=1 Tax=Dickeya aquatica TaxID=1401087 RepID=A0A375AA13_9GAMM|nr:hypothetical protein DAQ1742_01950 [Dickeya aquatica]